MKHTLNIYPEDQLVVIHYSGEVTLAEFGEMAGRMLSHPDYQIHFRGVSDFRQAHTKMDEKEFEQLAQSAIDDNAATGDWCVIAASPLETAYSMLYADKLEELHGTTVVSTIESASDHLQVDLSQYLPKDRSFVTRSPLQKR